MMPLSCPKHVFAGGELGSLEYLVTSTVMFNKEMHVLEDFRATLEGSWTWIHGLCTMPCGEASVFQSALVQQHDTPIYRNTPNKVYTDMHVPRHCTCSRGFNAKST
jgi:hypothetical protein